MQASESIEKAQQLRKTVREGYGRIAQGAGQSCCGSQCADSAEGLSQALGYGQQELAELPEGADMGLSCGNPVAMALLNAGDIVVDLGSGGGFDAFIAARKVGPEGRVIGVDMTPEMIEKARSNIVSYRKSSGYDNVEFRLGEIEHLPLPDASVDVVLSNCVINLSPDKPQVWRDIARVLKSGGRVAVSDLAVLKPLPPDLLADVESLLGCVAGAVSPQATRQMAQEAGLAELSLESNTAYIDAMESWQDPVLARIASKLPPGSKMSDFVSSLSVTAFKP